MAEGQTPEHKRSLALWLAAAFALPFTAYWLAGTIVDMDSGDVNSTSGLIFIFGPIYSAAFGGIGLLIGFLFSLAPELRRDFNAIPRTGAAAIVVVILLITAVAGFAGARSAINYHQHHDPQTLRLLEKNLASDLHSTNPTWRAVGR